ncbi:GlxA family transcriptional regulator [Zavarzinella formosa]|uniref:GlxA family transcriptional regulator n=1 Tax=Zavarzinella formosa TaxID=360055 RepID=UPI0002F13F64|nr:helix-turn-helix domain-containing protein [Zavarzinella formosa]
MRPAIRGKHEPEQTATCRRIVFMAFPGVVLLDLAGPWDVFNGANQFAGPGQKPYSLELVSVTDDIRIETAGGPPLVGRRRAGSCRGPIDTLVVPAALSFNGDVSDRACDHAGLGHLRRLARGSRRVVSVCGGTFILAAAGLLDGRRVTTHWRYCDDLARKYPGLMVESDRIFVRDGNVYTSAGVTAGMDLALALVEEDLGRLPALAVARNLVMFVRRPGGQTQYSTALESQQAERDSLRDLLAWAVDHLEQDLSVEAMAHKAHMSPRNFSRVFGQEMGETPARHIERLRVEAARQHLEASESDYGDVARRCGFGSVNSMRRSFLRVLKVTPSDYRKRFRAER